MALRKLKIIQHNVLSWTFERRNELNNLYNIEDPDIILINSHGRKSSEKMKIFNYVVYQKNESQEPNDGVAIAIKNGIKHVIIDDFEEDYLAIIVTTTLGEVCLSTGYQPPRRPLIPINNLIRIIRRNIPVYLIGDLNARHQILGHNNNNLVGNQIKDLISSGDLIHLGPDFQTFITPGRCGTPDIALGNNKKFHNILISSGDITTSDHIPVIMTISASPIQVPTSAKYNYNKANWTKFTDHLKNVQIPELNNLPATKINEELQNWNKKILNAMTQSIPKTSYKILPHPIIPAEVRDIINQYQQLIRGIDTQHWSFQQRIRLKALQTELQQAWRVARNVLWNSMLQKIDENQRDPAQFWKQIKRLMGTSDTNIPYIIDNNGRKLHEEKDQEAEFRRFWTSIFKISDEENINFCQETENDVIEYLQQHHEEYQLYNTVDLSRLIPHHIVISPITLQDVKISINKFKKNKAPGKSQINKQIMIHLPENMLKIYTHIINASLSVGLFPQKFKQAILKMIIKAGKPNTQVLNYRPISLLEIAAKIYEKIINERLKHFLEINNKNNLRQHSYRKNSGTNTAIAILYEQIANSQQHREQCNVVFRDVAKAFDKVWHDGLKYKILKLGLPRCFTALLCDYLNERTAEIQLKNYKGTPFTLKSGVPQGSVLAPTLYNFYVSDITQPSQSEYISYADDITQVIRYQGKSKEMMKRRTIRAIEEINEYEKKWKIKTNANKFQVLHISKHNPLPFIIAGRNINYSNSGKILGLKINKTGIIPHINERKNLATVALKKIKRFSKLNSKTKLHLYKALVLPHLEYPPIPLNIIKIKNKLKLQAVQNKALRWIAGDIPPYHTTIEQLHQIWKIEPINIRNFKQGCRVWNTIRIYHQEADNRLTSEEFTSSHTWWKKSYINENQQIPAPIYSASNLRNNPELIDEE